MSTILFHGSPKKVEILEPQPIHLQRERQKLDNESDAIYATEDIEEALVHAITKDRIANYSYRKSIDTNTSLPLWSLNISIDDKDLPLNELVYIYELNSADFKKNPEGEWYSTKPVQPNNIKELSIGEALEYFNEIKYERKPNNETLRDSKETWL